MLFLAEETRKTRGGRRCEWCGEWIKPKGAYQHFAARDEEGFVSVSMHTECATAMKREGVSLDYVIADWFDFDDHWRGLTLLETIETKDELERIHEAKDDLPR